MHNKRAKEDAEQEDDVVDDDDEHKGWPKGGRRGETLKER